MSGRRDKNGTAGGNGLDGRLSVLLCEWRDIEPCADFDERVWRRIGAAAKAPEGMPIAAFIGRFYSVRAFLKTAVAAAAAIAIGVMAGIFASPGGPRRASGVGAWPHNMSLAGSYVGMVLGGEQ